MPSDSWCFLAFIRKSAMLEVFSCCSTSSSEASLRPLLLLLDKFSGKMDRGSVKDSEAEEAWSRAERRGEVGGGRPKRVLTRSELLNPDKNGDRLPPKAATTAAYCK